MVDGARPSPSLGWVLLKVDFCGLCATDASLAAYGHRDARVGVVPGHEFCGEDASGRRYVVWPGFGTCGACRFCSEPSTENMCSEIGIFGFTADGGMAEHAVVEKGSLIPLPAGLSGETAVFAEPVASSLNALSRVGLSSGERLVVVGGGVFGMLLAFLGVRLGASVVVLEREASKRSRGLVFAEEYGFEIVGSVSVGMFDVSINACASSDGFVAALSALRPLGRCCFFGGLKRCASLSVADLNEVHYRQLSVVGAYGCVRSQMVAALDILADESAFFAGLTEDVVCLGEVPSLLERVLSGESYRYVARIC